MYAKSVQLWHLLIPIVPKIVLNTVLNNKFREGKMASIEVRNTCNRKKTYRVKVRLKGHPIQSATFNRLTDARRWAQATESAIREGRYFKTSEAKRRSLAEMLDRYLEDILPQKPKSIRTQKTQLLWWKRTIGAYTLADITPALVGECRDKLLKDTTTRKNPRSPATVNRYLAVLSHAFTIAIKEWGWIENNPVRKITRPREPRGRTRFLSDEERERLLQACRESSSPLLYPLVVLCLSTGARLTEALSLKWSQVDFQLKRILLHETKNGERRVLPLLGHAFELLQELNIIRRIDTDLIFPAKNSARPFSIRFYWNRVIEKAKLENFRFHDLRHSAASYLAMNGATLAEIAEILGHKTLQMVKRYTHLSESHIAKVVERMNEGIFGIKINSSMIPPDATYIRENNYLSK